MSIANLHETILAYKLRRNQLNLDISAWQDQKSLALTSQADIQSLQNAEKSELRNFFKKLYNEDETLKAEYTDYTEIPDFEEEIDKLTAKYQTELEELARWEAVLESQITTADAEGKEIDAYLESYKEMLSSNISEDFNFGLNS